MGREERKGGEWEREEWGEGEWRTECRAGRGGGEKGERGRGEER